MSITLPRIALAETSASYPLMSQSQPASHIPVFGVSAAPATGTRNFLMTPVITPSTSRGGKAAELACMSWFVPSCTVQRMTACRSSMAATKQPGCGGDSRFTIIKSPLAILSCRKPFPSTRRQTISGPSKTVPNDTDSSDATDGWIGPPVDAVPINVTDRRFCGASES